MRIKFITKKGVTRCVHCLELAKRDDKGRIIPCEHPGVGRDRLPDNRAGTR